MMNVQTELSYKVYAGDRTRAAYRYNTVTSKLENYVTVEYSAQLETPVTALENALNELATVTVRSEYEPLDITVTVPEEINLTDTLKTDIADRFGADTAINSVQFA